ncbi:MAG: hypothetical protein IAG10_08945 [Planctomycetaceae bacterium]|nr:hypothetical protein [Planctomycetaceae bacterium]
MSEDLQELKSKPVDWAVVLTKGGLGAIPFVGSLLAEVIGNVIPSQRHDRLARFLKMLDERLQTVEHETLKARLAQPEVVDVLEDSFFQAARAVTEERLEHVTNVVSNGLSAEQLDTAETKRMLWLLGQLNDAEIIILRGELTDTIDELDDEEFRQVHAQLLAPDMTCDGSTEEEFDEAAIKSSYRQHLFDIGLVMYRFQRPRRDELPEFDPKTGMMKSSGSEVTRLGRMFLSYLKLIPDFLRR